MGRPREWAVLGESAPYPCHRGEAGLLYQTIPGRRGGQVQQCATPTRARPHDGQVWLGPGAGDHAMRKSTARTRLRDRKRGKLVAGDVSAVALAVGEWDRTGIPAPTGVEFPHRSGTSRCDPKHPLWANYGKDRKRAEKRAGDPWEPGFDARVAAALAGPYGATARECVKGFKARERERAGKAVESRTRVAARARSAAVSRGVDTGSADYLDELLAGTRARRRR